MTNNNGVQCMFMGLPNSGKSSFIGALWHVIESGEIEDAYTVETQPDDREYLNELRDSFLGCKAPDRTKTEFVKQIQLHIRDVSTGNVADFTFPDLSGETFESQFEYRKISNSYLKNLLECSSIMLFINPQFLKKPDLISEADSMVGEIVEATESKVLEQDTIQWTPKLSQTQVMLVDLLQMISNKTNKPCKISVVISAWDLIMNIPDIAEPKKTPKEWLRINLPLLDQYLTANSSDFTHRVFGVSAQGDAYHKSKEGNKKLLSFAKQSERIKVQDGDNLSSDITVPFKWIING